MAITAEELVKKAKECGYDKCGIIPVEQMAGYEDSLDEREERLPETKEFYDKFRPFADPRAQYPWVKSIIVCSFRYGRYDIPNGLDKHYAKAYLTDGRRNAASGCWKAGERFDEYLEALRVEPRLRPHGSALGGNEGRNRNYTEEQFFLH